MRLGVRATLLLVAGYGLLMAALALGVDRWLRAAEAALTGETVRLLAREQTALLEDRIYGELEAGSAASRNLLRARIQDAVLLSEVLSSFAVVDAGGRVIGSDQDGGKPRSLPKPSEVFGDSREIRAVPLSPRSFFEGGDYLVFLPLHTGDRLAGYVRLSFHSQRVADLYAHARRQLLIIALAGLAGVGVLGLLLQAQVGRRAARITRALNEDEGGVSPPPVVAGPRDEFSRALAAATRVRQALQQARQESSRLHLGFSALAQVTKVGVLLLGADRRVEFANRRALELLGVDSLPNLTPLWSEAEATLAQAFPGEEPSAEARTLELPVVGGRRAFRVEVCRPGGADSDAQLILLNDPRIIDTLETDVRLASQLEGLARVYQAAAHEIKAPLSAMMINLDLLRETLTGGNGEAREAKERQQRYVSVLRKELTRLNRSLAEILTQRMPAREAPRRFDLARLLRELGTLLAPQARRQGVELLLQVPTEGVVLVGHPDRMKQALLNVAVNALEAMPEGGRLDVAMDARQERAQVSVRDTGPGIPRELLDRIYEPDFTTKGGGSGIGLYVARSLVQLHGGTVDVQSEVGHGTAVLIDLPLVPGS